MNFQSTRSKHTVSDTRAVLEGIAPDGGLYVDPELKNRPFDWRHCLTLSPLGMAEGALCCAFYSASSLATVSLAAL